MKTVTIKASESFLKKAVEILVDLANCENEEVSFEISGSELSPEDEAGFQNILDKYKA